MPGLAEFYILSEFSISSLSFPSFNSRPSLSLIHPTVTHITLWSGSSDLWFFNRSIAHVYSFCSVPTHTLFPLVPLLSALFPLTQFMTFHHNPVLFFWYLTPYLSGSLVISRGHQFAIMGNRLEYRSKYTVCRMATGPPIQTIPRRLS